MYPAILLTIYCVIVVGASLLGGWLPSLVHLTHRRLQVLMSAVGGLMLGIGLFHLLPHAVGPSVSLDRAIWWMMLGLLTTFMLVRVFHSHQHGPAEIDESDSGDSCGHGHGHTHAHTHTHDHDHDHAGCGHPAHDHAGQAALGGHRYRWVGIFLGLAIHTLLDGVAIAAAVMGEMQKMPGALLLGFGPFLGVVLHKPLDSLSITSLMASGGWSARWRGLINLLYAATCPLGAALFWLGASTSSNPGLLVGCALAFSAGIFVCLALGDLLPELHFHQHDRLRLTLALLLGVTAAYLIGYLEPHHHNGDAHHDHSHDHSH